MKNYTLWRNLLPVLAASLILANAPSVSAQGQGQGRRGGGGGGAAFQNATEEQQQARQQLTEATRDQAAKVRQARTDLNNAIFAAKVDEADIKAKVAALAKAEEEQAVARANAFAKVRAKFTSEQVDALKSGGGGGGGRGGAGGAGGGGRQGGRRGGNNN